MAETNQYGLKFLLRWNKGLSVPVFQPVQEIPAIPTGTKWIQQLWFNFGSGKRRPKWCSFGISGTGPKPIQPLRFAVFTVEPPVSGFLLLFLNFWFFKEPNRVKYQFLIEPVSLVRFLKPCIVVKLESTYLW
jgi:hypothetical protein